MELRLENLPASLRDQRETLARCLEAMKLAEALEKVLKAELIRLGWPLEKTHDLQRLAKLLRERGSDLVSAAEPLVNSLAEAYFADRYPGFDLDDPDWPVLREQL